MSRLTWILRVIVCRVGLGVRIVGIRLGGRGWQTQVDIRTNFLDDLFGNDIDPIGMPLIDFGRANLSRLDTIFAFLDQAKISFVILLGDIGIVIAMSFVAALCALTLMMRLLRSVSYTPYVIYRIALGVVLLWIAYT